MTVPEVSGVVVRSACSPPGAPVLQAGRSHVIVPRVGLQFARRLPFESWVTIGRQLSAVVASSAWCLGDWLIYGQQAYEGRYREAVEQTGLDYQTLRNYAWVARRFELSRRRDTLSFGHHAEVTSLSEPEQDFWLRKAEQLRWSTSQLRREVRASLHERSQGEAHFQPSDPDSSDTHPGTTQGNQSQNTEIIRVRLSPEQ